MKKHFKKVIAIIIIIIIVRNKIPFSRPDITVTYNENRVETAQDLYTWVPKNSGGNSGLGEELSKVEKRLHATTVKKGGKIKFRFKTILKQPEKYVKIIMINKETYPPHVYPEQEIKSNYFNAPEEKGEYVYLISGYWNRTHYTDYLVKINVE